MDDTNRESFGDSILSQLKDFEIAPTHVAASALTPALSADNLEQYILDKSKELIDTSVRTLHEFSAVLSSSPSEKTAEALSYLITSTTAALETLTKISNSNKKLTHSTKIKQMDIDSKKQIAQETNAGGLQLSHRDIMKMLNGNNVVDVEEIKPVEAEVMALPLAES